MTKAIFSIGHSNQPLEHFLTLLKSADVTAIADVRSSPFSRHTPAFNVDALKVSLKNAGLSYVFLGNELGGRPNDKALYSDGIADYEKMAQHPSFIDGLDRLRKGINNHRIALMCSEQNPLDCHRCLLVGRGLLKRKIETHHILNDGQQLTQSEIELQILAMANKTQDDLFADSKEVLALAYIQRGRKVAFVDENQS